MLVGVGGRGSSSCAGSGIIIIIINYRSIMLTFLFHTSVKIDTLLNTPMNLQKLFQISQKECNKPCVLVLGVGTVISVPYPQFSFRLAFAGP